MRSFTETLITRETMQSHTGFFKPTGTLVLPVTKVGSSAAGAGASSVPKFFYAEVKPRTKPAKPVSVDIDDLVAEFQSKSSANAKAMSKGRKWVAETFYKDRPNLVPAIPLPPTAMGIPLGAPAPCERPAHGLQGKTWVTCSWLHSLKG